MSKGHTLQDPYLNVLRKERVPVSIYLVNGIKLQGQIESFDQLTLLAKWSTSTPFLRSYRREMFACRRPRAKKRKASGRSGGPLTISLSISPSFLLSPAIQIYLGSKQRHSIVF